MKALVLSARRRTGLTMRKLSAKIRRMDIRKEVLNRLDMLNWSNYDLVQKLKGKVSERPVYAFLSGKSKLGIGSKALGHILDVIDLELRPKR